MAKLAFDFENIGLNHLLEMNFERFPRKVR